MSIWKKSAALLWAFVACASAFGTDVAILQNGFSIRHEHREVIGPVTRLYLGADNSGYVDVPTFQIVQFERDLTPAASPGISTKPVANTPPQVVPLPVRPLISPPALNDLINSAGGRHEIDPDLISSVIHAESGFNPRALSPKGAQGLMQLMPRTAANLGVANAFDPGANVEGGTRYLRELLELYNFDLAKALAAYNAGPLRVKQYRGVPPYYETRAYVAKIIRDFNRKKLAEQKEAALAAKNSKRQSPKKKSAPITQVVVEGARTGTAR